MKREGRQRWLDEYRTLDNRLNWIEELLRKKQLRTKELPELLKTKPKSK